MTRFSCHFANLTNIEKAINSDVVDNSIELLITVSTNNVITSSCYYAYDNMPMTINVISVSRYSQSLKLCHKANNTHSTSVIANTTSANINTPSDNMPTSVTTTKLVDDVHKTSNEADVFNQAHILISNGKTHANNGTSSANLSSGFLNKFMEGVQLRRDDVASVFNLTEYPLTVPQLRVLSMILKFTPLNHSVDRLSLRESIAIFERSCRFAEFFHETNNSDYDNRSNKFRS